MPTEPTTVQDPNKAMAGWITALRDEPAPGAAVEQPAKPSEVAPVAPAAPAEPAKPAAATKPAEVKPEPAKADDDDPSKWPRTADDWKKFKAARKEKESAIETERDAIKAERDRLNEEIAQLRKAGPSPELDKLKAERDELLNIVRVVDVEKDPRFKAHFDGRINAQVGLAKEIVGAELAPQVEKLLNLPDGEYKDSQIEDFLANLTPLKVSRLGGVFNSLSDIRRERGEAVANEAKNYEGIQAKRKAEVETRQAQQKTEFEGKFKGIVAELSDGEKANPLFKKVAGTDEASAAWNKEVDQRVRYAHDVLFGNHPPEASIRAALNAAATPLAMQWVIEARQENERLKEQIKGLTAARPAINGGNPPANEDGEKRVELKPGMTPFQVAEAFAKSMNG